MEGNQVAGEAGFVPYLGSLRTAARRLTSSEHEADDLVQDCLVCAVQGTDRARKSEFLGAWLHQILRRRWYDLLRRRAVERRHLGETRVASNRADNDASVGAEIVRRALQALDPDSRRVLELRFFHSKTSVEIAKELRKSSGSVRSSIFHALRKFELEFQRICPKETV
ncbi:MAG TPA: RNA polymerase sigma factor [Planctomycetota bacterium]|nr:RNA polymerase sigma factor [Planctomycetota bacterium]